MKSKKNGISIIKFIAIYFSLGTLWIFFSDLLLFSWVEQTSSEFFQWGIIKGFIFILVTSAVIFLILKNYSTRLKKSNIELIRANNLYKTLIEQSAEGIFRIELNVPFPISLPVDKQINLYDKEAFLAECNNAMATMYE